MVKMKYHIADVAMLSLGVPGSPKQNVLFDRQFLNERPLTGFFQALTASHCLIGIWSVCLGREIRLKALEKPIRWTSNSLSSYFVQGQRINFQTNKKYKKILHFT